MCLHIFKNEFRRYFIMRRLQETTHMNIAIGICLGGVGCVCNVSFPFQAIGAAMEEVCVGLGLGSLSLRRPKSLKAVLTSSLSLPPSPIQVQREWAECRRVFAIDCDDKTRQLAHVTLWVPYHHLPLLPLIRILFFHQ